jgi:Bacterial PH domain
MSLLRPVCWCAASGFLAFSVFAVTGASDASSTDVAWSVVLVVFLLRLSRSRIELDEAGLTVYNFFRTCPVRWDDVADVDVDYQGLRLVLTNGAVVNTTTMGKSNWSIWTHRRTKADERVDIIRQELRRRHEHG